MIQNRTRQFAAPEGPGPRALFEWPPPQLPGRLRLERNDAEIAITRATAFGLEADRVNLEGAEALEVAGFARSIIA